MNPARANNLGPGRAHRRGFALPLVVLLALVASVVAAIVLQRQSSQGTMVERQVRSYRHTHFERGLREVIGSWTNTLVGQPIDTLIGEDGHTLDIELLDGAWASVFLFDGQGSVVLPNASLTEQQRTDVIGIGEQLSALSGGDVDPAWFRMVGPVRISLRSAPDEVLHAIAAYAGSRNAGRFVTTINEARLAGELTQAQVDTAMNSAGLTPEQRAVVNRIVALRPELWAMVVEVYETPRSGDPGVLTARYLGRFTLPVGGGARSVTSLSSLGQFLSWEELPLE